MSTKTYTVRVPQNAPDLDSAQVSAWLDEQTEAGAALAPDPGAGPKVLRLTLDRSKVEEAAHSASESEAAFLRRLIATRADVKPEPREPEAGKRAEPKARPRAVVLPPRLRLSPDQLTPVVAAFDHVQALAISRSMGVPEAAAVARMDEEERAQLATATAELANRRAPAWLVGNVDLVGFASLLASIEFRKIDAAREVAEKARAQQASKQNEQPQPANETKAMGGLDVIS